MYLKVFWENSGPFTISPCMFGILSHY